MLEKLKNLDIDRMDIDDAVVLSAFARSLRSEYEQLGAEVPEWLDNRTRELRREIKSRQQDVVEKRLREAKSRLAALRTTEEKRAEAQAEIERLEKMLQG